MQKSDGGGHLGDQPRRWDPLRSDRAAGSGREVGFDTGVVAGHLVAVKHLRPAREPKTKGTLIVEQHRPVMNKLTDAERQQLMRAGMELSQKKQCMIP